MRLATLLAALVLLTAPAESAAEWRSLRTEHFQLIGDASPRQLRDVALRFEQFREIVTRLNLAATPEDTSSPLTIIVFRDRRSFEPFMPRANGRIVEAAGMFVEGPDSVSIAVRLDGGDASYRTVFHEYTHLLLRRVFPDAPLWFDEGLAEYYSTLRITGERSALIGLPVAAHIRLLQQAAMPLTQMFAATNQSPEYTGETAARSLLYAQAWAMVHHAFQSKPQLGSQMIELAKKLAAGGNVDDHFRAIYGMSVADLELRITGYVRSGKYTGVAVTFQEELLSAITADSTAITDAEADGWLGDLLAQSGRDDEALPRLESALSRQPDLGQAHEALAMLLLRKDRTADANRHLEQAKALGRNVEDVLRKTRSAAAPPAGFRQAPAAVVPPPPPGARPSLRITLADEQRAFGMLEALECKGDQVEFVVRTTAATVRAGGRFADINVVSYRPGSLGDLLCGAQKAPLPTLLTWRMVGELRRAVAVEFVPDGFVP